MFLISQDPIWNALITTAFWRSISQYWSDLAETLQFLCHMFYLSTAANRIGPYARRLSRIIHKALEKNGVRSYPKR
uniref:Uncharacterized protein n=1 Tax=Romanomermis culicivorax TaxID=13658 RepID=A0A915J4X5_ROMCU